MANEIQTALQGAATKVAQYIDNASTLSVETRFIEIGADTPVDFDKAPGVARTVIKLDGDSFTTIPMRTNASGILVPDADLIEMHQRSVAAATEYRASILKALMDMLRGLRA